MHPLSTQRHEMAALQAATHTCTRLTMLNFVVFCSTWFVFSDRLWLFFFSHSNDDVLAYDQFRGMGRTSTDI